MTVGEYNTFQFQPIVGFVKTVKTVFFLVYILTDFGMGSLVIIIYIGHYFLPIAYVIFILTQRLVPVV
jgi:hypothetical protein